MKGSPLSVTEIVYGGNVRVKWHSLVRLTKDELFHFQKCQKPVGNLLVMMRTFLFLIIIQGASPAPELNSPI